MSVKFLFKQPEHKLWVLCHQTLNLVTKCEDKAFASGGLTSQQMGVMMAIKNIKPPVSQTEVARWLDRSTNSVSMIIDRMERDGLVRRRRDLTDRRSLRLVITKKGKEAFEQALDPGWELINHVLSNLTKEEMQTLNELMEKIREKADQYLSPGASLPVVPTDDERNFARFVAMVKKD